MKVSMDMLKSELVEAAEERDIKVPSRATKREIIDLIQQRDAPRFKFFQPIISVVGWGKEVLRAAGHWLIAYVRALPGAVKSLSREAQKIRDQY